MPGIGVSTTAPLISGLNVAVFRSTGAISGIWLEMTASWACDVPGTEAFTFSFGLSSGMNRKSDGRSRPLTYCHGPERPGAPEPAARHEHVDLLVGHVVEDVGRRVLHVEKLRAVERRPVGSAFGHDQLRGRRGHDELRRSGFQRGQRLRLGIRTPLHQVDDVLFREGLRGLIGALRRCRRDGPRTGETRRLKPAVEDVNVDRSPFVAQDQRPRVQDPPELRPGELRPDRIAVDRDEDGGARREDERRRRVADGDRLRLLLGASGWRGSPRACRAASWRGRP